MHILVSIFLIVQLIIDLVILFNCTLPHMQIWYFRATTRSAWSWSILFACHLLLFPMVCVVHMYVFISVVEIIKCFRIPFYFSCSSLHSISCLKYRDSHLHVCPFTFYVCNMWVLFCAILEEIHANVSTCETE